jgi:Putative type VII ESX secretion system translocon, EccE
VSEGVRYEFPPPQHKHVLGSWTAGQLAIALVVLAAAVFGIIRPDPSALRVLLAAVLAAALLVPVAVPWHGRVITEWVPIGCSYMLGRLTGRTDYRSAALRLGTTGAGRLVLPAEVGSVEFLAHPYRGGLLGVAVDRRAGLYTGVLEVDGPSFLLEDTTRQEELLGRWGVLLGRLASEDTAVQRLQWIARTTADDGHGLRAYLERARVGDLDQASAVVRSYLELLRTCGQTSSGHATLLAVQVSSRHSTRAIRAAGGGDQGACAVLAETMQTVADSLDSAEVSVRRLLSPRQYQGMIRMAFDPAALADLNLLAALHPGREWGSDAPWPYATEERWGYYRTADQAWHRSFELVLPMSEVPADWLVPMMLSSQITRTVSATLKGVPRQQANRQVKRALTASQAEQQRKQQLRQLTTVDDEKRETAAARRMRELAEGHADMVYAITVTVTAPDLATLDQACRSVDAVAGQSSCELRVLEGQQAAAFTWTLPLGRGLA